MKSSIAILGSSGLIGSQLANSLETQGFTVTRPSRNSMHEELMRERPRYIINCIGAGMDIRRNQTKEQVWAANYEVPMEILKLAESLEARFVNIGSLLEKIEHLSTPYIQSKRKFSREIVTSYERRSGAVSILTPITYGLDVEHAFIAEVLNAGKTCTPVQLESPKAVREFIHVSDLARIILKLVSLDSFTVPVFEIGTGTGYCLSELCDSTLKGRVEPAWLFTPRAGKTNEFAVVADVDFLNNELGIQLFYGLPKWLQLQLGKTN
jgi:nucleoside-diphosphate-sugar epimerase